MRCMFSKAYPNAETVRGLRQWWEVLIHNVRVLRAEDEAARELVPVV
jgi:hypothetical protein